MPTNLGGRILFNCNNEFIIFVAVGEAGIEPNARKIEIVAGPNGSGKTTFAESYFLRTKHNLVFLNPDIIAAGFSPIGSQNASVKAGRILISEIKSRISHGSDFSFETTMSGKTYLPILRDARQSGYQISIYFLFVTSIEKSIERIANRVKHGGHSIPKESVLRRYPRCFANFWYHYRPLAESWYIFDNSTHDPELILTRDDYEIFSDSRKENFVQNFLEGKGRG